MTTHVLRPKRTGWRAVLATQLYEMRIGNQTTDDVLQLVFTKQPWLPGSTLHFYSAGSTQGYVLPKMSFLS